MPDQIGLTLTTCPKVGSAECIATALIVERLAACVNQIPGICSTYMWNDQVQRNNEVLLLIKTTATQLATVETRLKALHPYELPEFIAVPVCAGRQPYLNWIGQNVGPQN